jgi:uncharacterized glyoxalase superfamily protein PhnB
VLKVPDVVAAAEHYRDRFGFEISFVWGDPPQYATIRRDDAPIHFSGGDVPDRDRGAAADVYLFVSDIDDVFGELKDRGANIQQGLETWPYGMREFTVEDLNGYRLCFGESVEEG